MDPTTENKETLEINFVDLNANSQEDDASGTSSAWALLLPVSSGFAQIHLKEDIYTFGRGSNSLYVFNNPVLMKKPHFAALSNLHFTIKKEENQVGVRAFIYDNSTNGTFLNGELIGKNNKRPLHTNDEISLPAKNSKAFVYIESGAGNNNNGEHYPIELLDRYIVSRTLGRGAMGEVKLLFAKTPDCEQFAVKIIAKNRFTPHGRHNIDSSAQIKREIEILKAVDHPCIIKIFDVFDTDDKTFIVLEIVHGGELFDRIVSRPNSKLPEPLAKLYFYQTLLAIQHLHELGITHRDLKPENILLATDADETLVKVTDFGLSKFVDGESMMKTFCGTPNYLAPEVLVSGGCAEYTQAVDLWSVGVILFVALAGYPPFSTEYTDMDIQTQIKTGRYKMYRKNWEGVSETAVDLAKKLLTVDVNKRLSVQQALEHPWLNDRTMRQRAAELMYPHAQGMLPPRSTHLKTSPRKRSRSEANDDDDTVMMENVESSSKRHAN